jgi:hypothetical protein
MVFPDEIERGSQDSIVGIATGYGMDDRRVGVRVSVGSIIFSSPRRPNRLWVRTTFYPMGTEGSYPEVKASGA